MDYFIQRLRAADLSHLTPDLVRIYSAAFQEPPYAKTDAEIADFAKFLPIHSRQNGFRIVVGFEVGSNRSAGFAYGRTVEPGQPWLDWVRPFWDDPEVEGWLADTFQLVEMAVAPAHQRRGLGGGLHDELLARITQGRAVLATMDSKTPAFQFYRLKGWIVLQKGISVPGRRRTYQLMGLENHNFPPRRLEVGSEE